MEGVDSTGIVDTPFVTCIGKIGAGVIPFQNQFVLFCGRAGKHVEIGDGIVTTSFCDDKCVIAGTAKEPIVASGSPASPELNESVSNPSRSASTAVRIIDP